eukprot:gb/GECG01015944.1/.p1 GENE.gb/GECG01015944.1/~~gb/GECG01015944.1/.p1  ORF type:complete len:159 (+),score=8.42 gb/GECG01015944.1/:1-477(+)
MAIELAAANEDTIRYKGVSLNHLGRFAAAIACLDSAIAKNCDYGKACFDRGLVLAHLNRHMEAISRFRTALDLGSKCTRRLTWAYHSKNEIVIQKPLTRMTWRSRWIATMRRRLSTNVWLKKLGRDEKAVSSFETAITLNPKYKEACKNKSLTEETRT